MRHIIDERKGFSPVEKRIKALEITHAYAEYKIRHAGDLDNDLANWANNIMRFIENERAEK